MSTKHHPHPHPERSRRSRSRSRNGGSKDDVNRKRRREQHSRSRSPESRRSPGARSRRNEDKRESGRTQQRSRSPRRERRRSRSGSPQDRKAKRRRSQSSSSSSSDSSARRGRQERRKERRKRSKERKDGKKDKDAKKDMKKKKRLREEVESVGSKWGKYGLISDADVYNKEAEFRTWLVEERMINPETITKDQTKKEFAKFIEDFNTATLPHKKYYDMAAYDREMNMLRSGETLPLVDETYDPSKDLLEHASRLKKGAPERESYLSKEQLRELRKVQHERTAMGKMKAMGLDVKSTMGVRMENGPNDLED